jgi:RNA polymerase sigma-70 factor (ECF subfamily)
MTAALQPSVEDDGLDLVRRHQAGDPDAFAEIYRSHYARVFQFVYRRVTNRPLAEDITQETFTRAFTRLTTNFECRDKAIAAWLVTIARNLVSDHFKKWMTRNSAPVDVLPESTADRLRAPHAPAADEQVLADLDRADILTALLDLTEHQQAAIVARYFRGLSVAEASAEMGVSDAALKTLTHRAVQGLARRMNQQRRPS